MTPTIPFSPSERAALAQRWSTHPGMQHMGAQADFSDPATVRVFIDPVLPVHRGGLGTEAVNGAVISGLFDVAIGIVGHFQTLGKRAGTAQLNINFLRPLAGTRVEVLARLVRSGTNLVFAEAEARNQEGTVCARASGIVAVSGSTAPGENNAL